MFKMRLVIATKNKGKIREIDDFFKHENLLQTVELLTFADFKKFPEVIEGSESFIENAIRKARQIAEFTGFTALADDSGLVVDALNGKPGVTSSSYAGPSASDSDNRLKLLKELEGISDLSKRTARFICKMVLWKPKKGMLAEKTGICEGKIGFIEVGTEGFGYDSLFIPEGYNKTMAQISQSQKNTISHRGRALQQISGFLKNCL